MEKRGRPKGGKNRRWEAGEKLRIVKRYLEESYSSKEVAAEEGIDDGMVRRWARQYQAKGMPGLENQKKTGNRFSALHTSKSLSEEERLRLTVAKQQVEIARLKNGYTAEGSGAGKVFVTSSGMSIKSSKK